MGIGQNQGVIFPFVILNHVFGCVAVGVLCDVSCTELRLCNAVRASFGVWTSRCNRLKFRKDKGKCRNTAKKGKAKEKEKKIKSTGPVSDIPESHRS